MTSCGTPASFRPPSIRTTEEWTGLIGLNEYYGADGGILTMIDGGAGDETKITGTFASGAIDGGDGRLGVDVYFGQHDDSNTKADVLTRRRRHRGFDRHRHQRGQHLAGRLQHLGHRRRRVRRCGRRSLLAGQWPVRDGRCVLHRPGLQGLRRPRRRGRGRRRHLRLVSAAGHRPGTDFELVSDWGPLAYQVPEPDHHGAGRLVRHRQRLRRPHQPGRRLRRCGRDDDDGRLATARPRAAACG